MQLEEIRRQLRDYGSFEESILLDVQWLDQGTTIVLVLDCTCGAANRTQTKPDASKTVRVRFSSVQELHVSNSLSRSMLENMSELNWGLSEIARVQVDDAVSFTSRYRDLPSKSYHAAVLWQGSRRIDIVFGQMTIEM